VVIGAANIAIQGLIRKALGAGCIVKSQTVRIAIDTQRQPRRADGPAGRVFSEIPCSRRGRLRDQQA
jgi:hypothetical protein